MALQDGGAADRLREMTLAGAGRAEEEDVLALQDEAAGGQVVDQRAVHLLVEIEIEGVERAIGDRGSAPAGCRRAMSRSCRRTQFVADERGDEIDGRLLLGLRLAEARVEACGHAGEPELAERVIEFDEIHAGLLSADR